MIFFFFLGGGGGGGQEDFLKKIIRSVIRTNKIDRMTKQTKKNIQDGVKKRRARKCQKTNGQKLKFDNIMKYKLWRGASIQIQLSS